MFQDLASRLTCDCGPYDYEKKNMNTERNNYLKQDFGKDTHAAIPRRTVSEKGGGRGQSAHDELRLT